MTCSKLLPPGAPPLVWEGMGHDNGSKPPDPRDRALELAERALTNVKSCGVLIAQGFEGYAFDVERALAAVREARKR